MSTEDIDLSGLMYCWPNFDEIGMAKVTTKTGDTILAVAVGLTSTPESESRMFLMIEPDEARALAVRLIEEATHADEGS